MFLVNAELSAVGSDSASCIMGLNLRTPGVFNFLSGGTRYSSPLRISGNSISVHGQARPRIYLFTAENRFKGDLLIQGCFDDCRKLDI